MDQSIIAATSQSRYNTNGSRVRPGDISKCLRVETKPTPKIPESHLTEFCVMSIR